MNFRLIKSLDIGYITLLYFISAYLCAYFIDQLCSTFFKETPDEYSTMTTKLLFIQIMIQVIITGIVTYLVRNIIVEIPSPLDGIDNFSHNKVKELNSSPILLMFMMTLQKNLQKKIGIIRERM